MSMEYLNQHKDVIDIWLRQAAKLPTDNTTLLINPKE